MLSKSKKRMTDKKPTNSGRVIVLGFLLIILIGTVLLSLPISTKSGSATPLLTALFTATSATCVTGLVIVDTYTHWNLFGQIVILIMIQIGGLGFMTMASLFSFALRRRITLKERLMMSSSLNVVRTSGIVKLTKRILIGTLMFEGIGAIILATRFYKDFGFIGAIWRGIFHSISAFCNAGFDILGHQNQFNSLTDYVYDPIFNITIMALITIGGLGFFVWDDLYTKRRLSTHTRIVLVSTVFLIVGGSVLFYIFEFSNHQTIGDMNLWEKALASCFQSVTTRTAGFNTISQGDLTPQSTVLTYILMFIGGSPGSTAGGVKTVTIAILVLAAFDTLRGKTKFVVGERNINTTSIFNALSIFMIGLMCIVTGAFLLSMIEPYSFSAITYEVVSAFATVGLSVGLTPVLSTSSHIILIMLMFLGRVGILTLGFSLFMGKKVDTKISYPEGIILIG